MQTLEHRIFIVGAGINTPSQLSLEAVETLHTCEEVWTNIPARVQETLPGSLPSIMKSLKGVFLPDRERGKNYAAMIDHILQRAAVLTRVGYLTQGHPVIFDSVAAGLMEKAT